MRGFSVVVLFPSPPGVSGGKNRPHMDGYMGERQDGFGEEGGGLMQSLVIQYYIVSILGGSGCESTEFLVQAT
jgi:hypothetical protein